MESYLKLIEQIGEGAFSKLYKAYDSNLKKTVALKIEKNPYNKSALKKEYDIYKLLSSIPCIPQVYNFISNITNETENPKQLNCIEMELLGKNLLSFKKSFSYYNKILCYDILVQCLLCVKKIHERGYIHRDIKPSNFCLHIDEEKKIIDNYKKNIYFNQNIKIYLIDFGLVKNTKNEENIILENKDKNQGFVGTLTYASLSAHNNEELGKKDDLWSFFFMILDLMEENLPWRFIDSQRIEEIKECKKKCIDEPNKYLFLNSTKNNKQIYNIFEYLKNLKFETEPDYNYIMNQLLIIKNKEIQKIIYNYEINNQILLLQKNLLIKPGINNDDNNQIQEQRINKNNISNQDYINYKLHNSNNKSIPSLNSTNYSTSIYYKTNYINCISSHNNENFYQSVLKPLNESPNKINSINHMNYINNARQYDYNNIINLHPMNYNTNSIFKNPEEKSKKKEIKYENDKSLIEFLIGKSNDDSPQKKAKKESKKNKKKIINQKINIHDKRKAIKFSVVKKGT